MEEDAIGLNVFVYLASRAVCVPEFRVRQDEQVLAAKILVGLKGNLVNS